ncbi:MAG: mercuric reductase [Chitinophagaceae bacterium]
MEHYQAVIIGSGQGGTPLSKKLASAGWKTALVEKAFIGGTCVNVGCTPTKTMISSARTAYLIAESGSRGVRSSKPEVDIREVINLKNKIVAKFRNGSEKGLEATENLTVIHGEAIFSREKTLRIKFKDGPDTEISADKIFIDIGTRPNIPKIEGLEDIRYLTSSTILDLEEIPGHLVVIGGNYIGLEFGQMYKRFGSNVTILEKSERLLKKEDEDVSEEMHKILTEEGMEILFNEKTKKITPSAGGFQLITDSGKTIIGTHLLIATGRIPNTDNLNSQIPGVDLDDKGFIRVNGKLETSVKDIYAIGDVTGGPAFTHISYNDYIVIAANLLNGENRTTEGRQVPFCMFTDPQLGRVGMTEAEAKAKGIKYVVAKIPMAQVARAIETGETRGLMKALVDEKTNEILGAAIIGTEGGETMTVVQMAMLGKIKAAEIREMIFAHPLYAESLNNLFMSLEK